MKKLHEWIVFSVAVLSIGSLYLCWGLHSKVSVIAKESSALYKELLCDPKEPERKPVAVWDSSLCKGLKTLPSAEDLRILKSVKKVNLTGVVAPYNASFVEYKDGYLMVFRYDIKERKKFLGVTTPLRQKIPFHSQKMPYKTFIGAVRLDKNFNQISSIETIDTGSDFSEDPRIFSVGEKLYLSYNDMQPNEVYSRTMRLAELDRETLKPIFINDIDQHINFVEKNWVPFAGKDAFGKDRIFFGYGINPHKVLAMDDPQSSHMDHLVCPHNIAFQKLAWREKKWGVLRGGTPAILVNGQYLAFFHTLFYESKRPWYAMGAYTFEASPPYRITAVSPFPILFKGIFDTPAINTAHSKKKAIYPAGITLDQEDGKDVIHISCGENDSSIKILTFDKELLLQSLVPTTPYDPTKKSD